MQFIEIRRRGNEDSRLQIAGTARQFRHQPGTGAGAGKALF